MSFIQSNNLAIEGWGGEVGNGEVGKGEQIQQTASLEEALRPFVGDEAPALVNSMSLLSAIGQASWAQQNEEMDEEVRESKQRDDITSCFEAGYYEEVRLNGSEFRDWLDEEVQIKPMRCPCGCEDTDNESDEEEQPPTYGACGYHCDGRCRTCLAMNGGDGTDFNSSGYFD